MPWICSKCGRSFRNNNQSHSCMIMKAESLFVDKNAVLWEVYQKLLAHLKDLEGLKISPVKNAILFSVKTNFLAVKPKVNWLDIEFVSQLKIDEFPILKSIKVSKTKYANFIRLEYPSNIDKQLINWLHEAYKIDAK